MLLQTEDKTPRNLLSPDQKYFLYICKHSDKYQGRHEEISLFLKDSFNYRPEEHLRFFHLLDTKKKPPNKILIYLKKIDFFLSI